MKNKPALVQREILIRYCMGLGLSDDVVDSLVKMIENGDIQTIQDIEDLINDH